MLPTDLPADIRDRAARIKLAVFDVDGVLTDGKLVYAADGHEIKAFHVHDGLGFKRLLANGIEVAIITARLSKVVTERMAELGVAHVYQDQKDKRACLAQLVEALRLSPEQVRTALQVPASRDDAALRDRIALLIRMRNQL